MNIRSEVRAGIIATVQALRDRTLATWALYLALGPVYIWSSGLPQPGDWILLLLAPMVLHPWNKRLTPNMIAPLRSLMFFTAYVILANLLWSMILNAWSLGSKRGFLMAPTWYIYNGLAFLVVLVLYRRYRERLLWFTANAVLAAVLTQSAIALVFGGGGGRATVLFNNPNQLGYFALLSINILFLLNRAGYVTSLALAAGGVAASYLALISASKAALGGIALIVLVGSLIRLRTLLVVVSVFAITFAVAEPMRDAVNQTLARYENDQSASLAEERGYDRIADYPQYWVLGSGEGAYNRFRDDTSLGAHEIHSSIGTLFFCYGALGTVIFVAFVIGVMRGSGFRSWLLIMPSVAYGMAHQGLRTTLFWVLLALVVAIREDIAARRARR